VTKTHSIITIGLSPAWDITCHVDGIDWGRQNVIDQRITRPAGKALNVSGALAWMGTGSIAAGFWGSRDYPEMRKAIKHLAHHIRLRLTVVAGRTRENITVLDTAKNREIHLREVSELASKKAFRKLCAELRPLIKKDSLCVFAGSMPKAEFLPEVISMINRCKKAGAKIVLDTSGPPLKAIVDTGGLWLIKPNVDELRQLLGRKIEDKPVTLAEAAGKLLNNTRMVLISRDKNGAILVTKDGAIECRALLSQKRTSQNVFHTTVGCGDYLLAGFLASLAAGENLPAALRIAVKVATAKAMGLTEIKTWPQAERDIIVS